MREEINAKWNRDVDSDIGKIGFLAQPLRSPTETGLRRPYQYEIPLEKVAELRRSLKELVRQTGNTLQFGLVDWKPVKYGIRLHLFLLGHASGFTGDAKVGLGKAEWDLFTACVQDSLDQYLGEALMYVEPWNDKKKFQARFETYIKYKGL